MGKFRIVSFDGGGIRGLVSLAILRRLMESNPYLLDGVDMFSGTSTGGIIALGLAAGLRPDFLIDLYMRKGGDIFTRRWSHFLGLVGARYKHRPLEKILEGVFGDMRLSDIKKKVLIPTFDLDNECEGVRRWAPKFFHNFGDDVDRKEFIKDVALATSAAPTYFKSWNGYVDGGLIANNSSLSAVIQALDKRYDKDRSIDDIRVLSLGTGETSNYVKGEDVDLGMLNVGTLMEMVLDGTEEVPHHQCRIMLGNNYRRLNPYNYKCVGLDDWKQSEYLVNLGDSCDLGDTPEWLKETW